MIRKVEPNDREAYIGLVQRFYNSDAVDHDIPKKYIEATFDELMRSDVYADGYIMTHDGKPAGYALIAKTFSCEGGGLTVWVEEVFILPEYRSLGLGKALFATLEEKYGGSLARMRLEIAPDNIRAKSLYQKLGFQELPYQQMVKEFK
ncbi:GNAT family N-acetyltransferase [Oscillospiraceae bacterium LTW-04]|nr:GNAT family N-acetyltransferase [Oscillospiraceae bacterium MB24-C1]